VSASVVLRRAEPADARAITEIYAHYVLNGTASFDTVPRSEAETLERIEICTKKGWPLLVADQAGQVVGYAYAMQFRDRPAYAYSCENSIYVAAGRRGQGIGRLLLDKLVEEATAFGFRQMVAVAGGGEPASVGLHLKCGFVETGRMRAVGRKFGKWLDTVYLQKALGSGDSLAPPQEP
jgi:L-amino acid N-acyltransferase YncA